MRVEVRIGEEGSEEGWGAHGFGDGFGGDDDVVVGFVEGEGLGDGGADLDGREMSCQDSFCLSFFE